MQTLLLAALLITQGIPRPNQTGTITGVVRDSSGKPAVGVRVGAISISDSTLDVASISAMVSLAETDATGRYTLEAVPAGRYYIAAGRVDFPTYYPGTQALGRGTVVSVLSRATVTGIDFALQDSSSRTADLTPGLPLVFSLPVQVSVDGGGKLPVFSPRGFLFIGLTNTTTGIRADVPINASSTIVASQTAEYRVSVENVPPGFVVQSILAGGVDVAAAGLKLSTVTFQPSAQARGVIQMVANTTLTITLARAKEPEPMTAGVRVTGRTKSAERRSVYISGMPGTFYADGTFEFLSVPPGWHTIATVENPESASPLGASLIVGESDVQDIELEEVRLLPMDIRVSAKPRDIGNHSAGSVLHLPALRVTLVDEENRQPAGPGTVYVLGPSGTSFDLPADGRFEFPQLLPGRYSFEVRGFRRPSVTRTIVVDEQDITLELVVAGIE
jgi:hypothetical protein